jgi:hypothetical protein
MMHLLTRRIARRDQLDPFGASDDQEKFLIQKVGLPAAVWDRSADDPMRATLALLGVTYQPFTPVSTADAVP